MKTQISRDSFDIARRYSGVYLQQGRMIVDADVNELTDIGKTRLEAALADAVGSGAPRADSLVVDKSGSSFVIQPGRLYADGVPARLDAAAPIALTAQPDYRNPPTLLSNNFRVYADVWERPVSALEDTALQDVGLHGADTATRTKTMLQVKWCASTIDPLDPAGNPQRGNALLTLKLRLITAGADPCDPCAAEVVVDERIGNYLFRVEVHDVFTAAGDAHVVLKWSRDNGAEAYASTAYPEDFDQGDWVWEFFDGDSENLLGHHFPAGEKRRRGEIRTTFEEPASPLPNAFVRQWDGYAELNLTTGALVAGRDRGVDLSTEVAATAHAYVKIDGGASSVLINLELLELTLDYTDKVFLAGDYWHVAVRDAVDQSGDVVLGKAGAEPPRGILHHYAALAEVDGSANLVAFTDAFRRRMSFPPLTDLHAEDVGFTNNCNDLYGAAENVQQALDELCNIANLDAGDISADLPACVDSTGSSTLQQLLALPGGSQTVLEWLRRIYCDVRATHIPLDRSKLVCTELLTDLGVVSVQDAIDKLCQTAGNGCEITVPLGQLEQRLRDFAAESSALDIALCLLPGTHVIAAALSVTGKRSIRIKGAPDASGISFSGSTNEFGASAITLEDVSVSLVGGAQLQLNAIHVSSVRCQYVRNGSDTTTVPCVRIGAQAQRVLWQHNLMSDAWFKERPTAVDFTDGEVVGNARVADAFRRLTDDPQVFSDAAVFDATLSEITDAVAAMPAADRTRWAAVIEARTPSAEAIEGKARPSAKAAKTKSASKKKTSKAAAKAAATTSGGVQPSEQAVVGGAMRIRAGGAVTDQAIARGGAPPVLVDASAGKTSGSNKAFTDAIKAAEPGRDAILDGLFDGVLDSLFDSGVNVALALSSHRTNAMLTSNEIYGEVLLMNQLETSGSNPGVDAATDFRTINPVLDLIPVGGAQLTLEGNRMDRLWSLVPPLPTGQQLNTPLDGFAVCTLQGNHVIDLRNAVVARKLALHANHFDGVPQEEFDFLGRMLVRVFTAVGNTSTDSTGAAISMLSSVDARATCNYFVLLRF